MVQRFMILTYMKNVHAKIKINIKILRFFTGKSEGVKCCMKVISYFNGLIMEYEKRKK